MKMMIRLLLLAGLMSLVACATTEPVASGGSSANFEYDAEGQTLVVNFTNGRSYSYADVPADVFAELDKAESKGKAYNELVRGKFPSTRVK
jgi:hypothetical protein